MFVLPSLPHLHSQEQYCRSLLDLLLLIQLYALSATCDFAVY